LWQLHVLLRLLLLGRLEYYVRQHQLRLLLPLGVSKRVKGHHHSQLLLLLLPLLVTFPKQTGRHHPPLLLLLLLLVGSSTKTWA
jgi:hypothetical protein